MKTTNVLTPEQYQERLKALRTPEDAAAFAQEMFASTLASLPRMPVVEKIEESEEVEEPVQGKINRSYDPVLLYLLSFRARYLAFAEGP